MDLHENLQRETVTDVGYRALVSIEVDATIHDAVARMREEGVGCILVMGGKMLRGIFTERNLIARVLGKGLPLDTPITECMTPDPVVSRFDDPMHVALSRMHGGGFRHLPIVDAADRPLGILSVKRAVYFLGTHLPEMVYNVAPEPGCFPQRPEGG